MERKSILDYAIKRTDSLIFSMYKIMLCGQDCVNKTSCYRALMYQRYKNDNHPNKPTRIWLYNGAVGNCRLFWRA